MHVSSLQLQGRLARQLSLAHWNASSPLISSSPSWWWAGVPIFSILSPEERFMKMGRSCCLRTPACNISFTFSFTAPNTNRIDSRKQVFEVRWMVTNLIQLCHLLFTTYWGFWWQRYEICLWFSPLFVLWCDKGPSSNDHDYDSINYVTPKLKTMTSSFTYVLLWVSFSRV